MPDTQPKILGVLVPYFNGVVEPELSDLRPPGVTNQTARFSLDANVLQEVVEVATKLASCGPEAFIVGLSTEFLAGGLDLLRQGVEDVKKATGLPVFTASFAVHAALRGLRVRRISVATPFDAEGNRHVREAFEANGFSVAAIDGLGSADFAAIGRTPPDDVRRLFRAVDRPEAEALVQVGTGLPLLHLIAELERDLAKPVVACNAASYWQALRELGVGEPIAGFGRLLAER